MVSSDSSEAVNRTGNAGHGSNTSKEAIMQSCSKGQAATLGAKKHCGGMEYK